MKSLPVALFLIALISISATQLKAHDKTIGGRWEDCILVNRTGDSDKAQVKYRKDYSAEGSLLPGEQLLIRHADGKEIKLDIQTLTEILIPGKPIGSNHYLVLNTNAAYPGRYKIYRVVTDGICKLLYTEIPAKAGATYTDPSYHGATIAVSDERLAEQYYVYYNKTLALVHIDDDYNLNSISKSACIEIFKDCPELVKKLSDKNTKSAKLNLLVEEFNNCISK